MAGASGLKSLASFVVQVPVATNPNGKDPITGQVYSHLCTGTNGCGLAVGSAPTSTAQLVIQGPAFAPYQPASMDTKQAEFWTVSSQTFEGLDSKKTPIPSAQWAWAYCPSGWPGTPNPNWICLKNGPFNPSLLYEMAYTAKNPLVLGVGFAAFRDLGSFLRYETAAPGGGSNPISGTVKKTYTVGSSQSGAFIHGFIFWGAPVPLPPPSVRRSCARSASIAPGNNHASADADRHGPAPHRAPRHRRQSALHSPGLNPRPFRSPDPDKMGINTTPRGYCLTKYTMLGFCD